jgi:hypothetical protein
MPIGGFKLNSIGRYLAPSGGGGSVSRDNPQPSTYLVEGSVRTTTGYIGTNALGPIATTSSDGGFSITLSNPGTQTQFNSSTICCYEFWFKASIDADRKVIYWSTNSSINNMAPLPPDQANHMILYQEANQFRLNYFVQYSPVTLGARDSNWHHLAVQSNGNGTITVWYDGTQVVNTGVISWTQRSKFHHCMGFTNNSPPVIGNSIFFDEIVITHGAQKYTPGVNFTPYSTAQTNAAKTIGLFHCESTSQTDDAPTAFGNLSPGVGWSQYGDFVDPNDGFTYRAWYTSSTSGTSFDIISTAIYEYILIGGGGAGGGQATSTSNFSTGGGGGGFAVRGKTALTAGSMPTYTIGAGGVGAIVNAYRPGSNSTLTLPEGTITAPGGGGGAYYNGTTTFAGQDGVSGGGYIGGGGGAKPGSTTGTNAAGGSGNYNGGSSFSNSTLAVRSAGGGGSGGGINLLGSPSIVGSNGASGASNVGGNGGNAATVTNFIYNGGVAQTLYFGAGGGGGGATAGTAGVGGGNGAANSTAGVNATNSADWAGGGGGGCRRTTSGTFRGGNGAFGGLWIRYRIA